MLDINEVFEKMYPDFEPNEFSCKCENPTCIRDGVEYIFMSTLQSLRSSVDKPFHINSGYRCQAYNDSLPHSSPKSYHTKGLAADISTEAFDTFTKNIFVSKSLELFNGVGIYRRFVHVDLRPEKALWWGSY